MSQSSDMKDIARQFIQAWNADQRYVVDELAAPDLTVSYTHYPEPYHGPEAFKEMLAKTHHFFPDLSIEVRDVVAGENQTFLRWTYRGTFQNGEMFGVNASGQSVEVVGMTIHQIEDGAVIREEGIVDNLALMQQLGLAPGRPDSGQ
ncbi:MAG: ester cyclase [Salinibacter sp.]